jgi:hypothetical protein
MKAYPLDDGRFVKRQTPVKDWPVFSDYPRVIDQGPIPQLQIAAGKDGCQAPCAQ